MIRFGLTSVKRENSGLVKISNGRHEYTLGQVIGKRVVEDLTQAHAALHLALDLIRERTVAPTSTELRLLSLLTSLGVVEDHS